MFNIHFVVYENIIKKKKEYNATIIVKLANVDQLVTFLEMSSIAFQ